MKVIALNGSPRKNGNTNQALSLMASELQDAGIDCEIVQVGSEVIAGCKGCAVCVKSAGNACVITGDLLNETALKCRSADGIILASPTYYAGIAGTMKSFLDRLFYSSSSYFAYKVGTSVSVVRRAGGVDVVHQLNNYLNLAQMIIPPSQYWTIAYGRAPGEIAQDDEGTQTLRKNARAMAWLLKSLDAAKTSVPHPIETEARAWTNFIR
ncbi:MAG: flavodoxin family protein [Treponemataceae bacterium]|nr:MAG: flavodoxin family protein [Treponemataceae bacterium]